VEIPNTIAGKRFSEFLAVARSGTISNERYRGMFNEAFRSEVPLSRFIEGLSLLGASVRVEKSLTSTSTAVSIVVRGGKDRLKIDLITDAQGLIGGLRISPYQELPAPASSWSEIDQRLSKTAPNSAMVAATISKDGSCSVVHGLRETRLAPMGSMFKLFVMASVADSVGQGSFAWDSTIKVRDDWKSLPSGTMQLEAAGSTRTVADVADAMISISDNTATDHLIRTIGRVNVERTMKATRIAKPSVNQPLLTTRELFILKGVSYPSLASKYRKLDVAAKRTMLDGEVAKLDLGKFRMWSSPRDIDALEWFASPVDVCRTFAYLSGQSKKRSGTPIGHALSINDGGLSLDPKVWPKVWFKGGSEPGVLSLGFLAERPNGERSVVVMMVSDPKSTIDDEVVAGELESLIRAAFHLSL
jgi:Beta-lactamase enzyme family